MTEGKTSLQKLLFNYMMIGKDISNGFITQDSYDTALLLGGMFFVWWLKLRQSDGEMTKTQGVMQ